jgi:hypothetical protein
MFDVQTSRIHWRDANARELIAGLMDVKVANVRLEFVGREPKDSFVEKVADC